MAEGLIDKLRAVLIQLHQSPFPHVPTPKGCSRRASVAIIIRVRPRYEPLSKPEPSPNAEQSTVLIDEPQSAGPVSFQPQSAVESIDSFFSRDAVQHGDPEILFIKRVSRITDRWSGHTALPGGKRDPEDKDDLAAAIRETREEIGLDLNGSNCIHVGNLAERIVSTTKGNEALMVLCPYVFLWTSPTTPPLQPQPTEIAAVHWVPLRMLLSPKLRTREYVDFSRTFVPRGGPLARRVVSLLLGQMMFSAIRLIPSESVYASSTPEFTPKTVDPSSILSTLKLGVLGRSSFALLFHQQPLLLWGLTLGVLADFLENLPPYNAVKLWEYPTYSVVDLRFLIWLLTRSARKNNALDLSAGTWPKHTAMDATTQAVAIPGGIPVDASKYSVGIGGLGVGSKPGFAAGNLLGDYYSRMTIAIRIFLVYRAVLGVAAGVWLFKLWRRRRRWTGLGRHRRLKHVGMALQALI